MNLKQLLKLPLRDLDMQTFDIFGKNLIFYSLKLLKKFIQNIYNN